MTDDADGKTARVVPVTELIILGELLNSLAATIITQDGDIVADWLDDPLEAADQIDLKKPDCTRLRRWMLCEMAAHFDNRMWSDLTASEFSEYERLRLDGKPRDFIAFFQVPSRDHRDTVVVAIEATVHRHRKDAEKVRAALLELREMDAAVWERANSIRAASLSDGISRAERGKSAILRLDESLLAEIGLESLGSSDGRSVLSALYSELELRVGRALSDGLSDRQLEEFEKIIDAKLEIVGDAWLAVNSPDYTDVVSRIFRELLGELAESAGAILQEVDQWPA